MNHARLSVSILGRKVLGPIEYTLEVFLLIYLSFRAALFEQARGLRAIFTVVSAQIYFSGFEALPLISVLAFASGSLVILQSATRLSWFGGASFFGDLVVMVIVRELAPLLTALIVIARSGTAVASEIGNMRVNREIEALEAMGVHPLSYVVFPRLLGGMISVICLSLYFVFVAAAGGFLVTSLLQGLPLSFFLESVAHALTFADAWLFFLKTTFGGMMIFMISCHQGFKVKGAPHEVPQAATRAVVDSVIYVVGFNMIVTIAFYVWRLGVTL